MDDKKLNQLKYYIDRGRCIFPIYWIEDGHCVCKKKDQCENAGKHHIFAYVRDAAGNSIPGVKIRIAWEGGNGGEAIITTGTKMEDPGLADFAMFKGTYFAEVVDGLSQKVGPISPDIPRNETCAETGNGVANSLFHYSFEVIFTKVR